ncbi:GAF domain-containing protein [Archangium minus]|uniref:GAF domain-containing protein n=1 Tax=Archangium minus TaxID=83450 RepID=A0ABY9WPA3_9BACT|nr:GAF domain-containing protein [Archangium minus]
MSSDPPHKPEAPARELSRSTEESLGELRAENASLRTQVDTLRQERVRLKEKLSEAEMQMTSLVNLCVASHRLHETFDRRALLDIIREIINNIVGSEELGIFELDAERSTLSLVHSMGIEPERFQSLPLGSGVIGHTALTGERFVASDGSGLAATGNESNLTACIPLRIGSRVWGVIAIFGMLPQKPRLKDEDRELFALLENQAGLVLAASEMDPDGNRS